MSTKNEGQNLLDGAWDGDVSKVELALQNGADIHSTENGWTALHFASEKLQLDVVRLLLERGANAQLLHSNGSTPLRRLLWASPDLMINVELTVTRDGKKVTITDPDEIDRIEGNKNATAHPRSVAIARLLVEAGCDVNQKTDDGYTDVLYAVYFELTEHVEIIFESGRVDPNVSDSTGMTALHMAIRKQNVGLVKYLIDAGIPVNATEDYGFTALHEAAQMIPTHQIEIARMLLDAGADRTITTTTSHKATKAGSTAYDIAKTRGRNKLAELLAL